MTWYFCLFWLALAGLFFLVFLGVLGIVYDEWTDAGRSFTLDE